MTYLLGQLAIHFAPLGEEARMAAMSELMQFQRHPHETIGALLSRFMSLRHRSTQQGVGMTMNWEGESWLLVRACGVNRNQLLSLLQPLQGRFPSTEAEFQGMSLGLWHMGHILEGAPSDIAAQLPAPARAHVAMDGTVGHEPGHEASAFLRGAASLRLGPLDPTGKRPLAAGECLRGTAR